MRLIATKKKPATVEDLIKVLKDFDASKIKLTAAEKSRFERIRLAEKHGREVDYELGQW